MSAEVLQRLQQDGALTIGDMADLFNIQQHSVYPYFDKRELKYSHVRTLCRRAIDQRIAAAFFNDLMQGTGWSAIYIDADLDFDGDGDIDTDDVLAHAIDALAELAKYLKYVQKGCEPDPGAIASLRQTVIQHVIASERCAAHIVEMKAKNGRRKARTPSHIPHKTSNAGSV